VASNKKITDLDEISSITVADDDVLAIVDVSQDKTYKIRKDAFEVAISGVTSMAAGSPLATNASTGSVVLTLNTVPVAKGGTGAITATDARDNLGLGSIATQNANSIAITGGTATLSSATLSTADINGGTIDNTTVGATTPSSGSFTTLAASSGYTGSVTGNVTGNVTGSVTGNVTGNITSTGTSSFNNLTASGTITGDVTGNVTGNSTTATRLQTARTIAGQSFDGTANISIGPTNLTGVTATATEINKLDGFTGDATDLNYAKSLYDTGVTATEFDKLDGVNGTIWHNGNDALSYVNSNSTSGYVKLPNGLYIQWGYYSNSSWGYQTISFPIAFPSYCFSCVGQIATAWNNPANPPYYAVTNLSRSSFQNYTSGDIPTYRYIAIGI